MKTISEFLLIISLMLCSSMADESGISAHFPGEQFCVFGGKETVFDAMIGSKKTFTGRLGWRFSTEGRTLARGEIEVNTTSASTETVEIPVHVPEVKDGVIFEASLELSLFKTDSGKEAYNTNSVVWIFPENPFYGKQAQIEQMDIRLFDPEHKTGEILTAADIAFKTVENIERLLDFKGGIVIIGEGVSFTDYRALPEIMLKMAHNGVSVLCLAPKEGVITVAETNGEVEPVSMNFRHQNIIRKLDKRLASDTWPPDGRVLAAGLKLRGERGFVYADVVEPDKGGWPWIELRFGHETGRLILCGFAIMEKWESGPVPRFLFERMLEYMMENKKKS